MNKYNIKNLSLFIISLIIISLLVGFLIFYLVCNNCFFGDDFWFSRYITKEDLLNSFLLTSDGHGNGYIGLLLCKLFCFGIPTHLNIHPNDFMSTYHSIFKIFFSISILLLITKLSTTYYFSKRIFLAIFTFISAYFFFFGIESGIFQVNYNFYRYFFSLLPLSYFILFLNNKITNQKKKNKLWEIILFWISGYACASSSEIIIFTISLTLTLILGYNLLITYLKNITKIEYLKKPKLDFIFYISTVIVFTVAYFFTSNPDYKRVANDRGLNNIVLTLETTKEFIQTYIKIYFLDIWIYWLIFALLLCVSIYFTKKKNEFKKILLPIILQVSILIVIFSLILCGKTFQEETQNKFYLYHHNIIFLFKLYIMLPILIIFSYVCKNIRKSHLAINIICFSLIICSPVLLIIKKNNFITINEITKERKKEQYQYEKMLRFYYLQEKTPIIYAPNYRELEWEKYHKKLQLNVMNIIYKNNDATKFEYILDENAFELYKKNGGTFEEEELEKLHFEKLKDKNFVLNKK